MDDLSLEDSVDDGPPPKFTPIQQQTRAPPLAAGAIELLLVQAKVKNLTSHGELPARKRYVRVQLGWLKRNERLSALLPSAEPGQPLHVPVVDEALSIEAIAQALEMQALPAREQQRLLEHTTWQPVCALLQAAAWLGSAPLVSACETKLCAQASLDNVSAIRPPHPLAWLARA